ncbi:MAG: bacterial Ig-like domain-containing protein, partial [Clostridia bacterium]|nr:bacterial Ig-like domain-containing protein [Clostridia bacterium]
FTITVLENKVASLSLITSLGKQYRQGSSIDLARVELLVTYEDGQSRTIDARDCVVTINGKTSSTFEKAGEAEIVFTYQGVSTGTVAVKVAEDPMNTFIIAAIIIVSLLIGVPLVILLIIFLVRRAKDKREEARHPIRRYTEETAEEIASFEEEDEEELRIFEERAKNSDTVALPKIATGMPSIRPAEDTPTIQIPKASDSSALDGTRKIDFFDEL